MVLSKLLIFLFWGSIASEQVNKYRGDRIVCTIELLNISNLTVLINRKWNIGKRLHLKRPKFKSYKLYGINTKTDKKDDAKRKLLFLNFSSRYKQILNHL